MTLPDAEILSCSADEYHTLPGLSFSIAATLHARSPLHAYAQHPCLGGKGKRPTRLMDRGAIIHRLVLGKGADFAPLAFDDYRTNAAKAARDAARAAGKIPVLESELRACLATAQAIAKRLNERGIKLTGASEVPVRWWEPSRHGPVECRGMIDHLWLTSGRLLDLKVVQSAAPASVERSAESFGYGIQWAAYTRAVSALRPDLAGRIEMLFAFCEAEEPHAVNLCRPDGIFRELGERRWLRAVERWSECMTTDTWPGYGEDINPISAPQWALQREDFDDANV